MYFLLLHARIMLAFCIMFSFMAPSYAVKADAVEEVIPPYILGIIGEDFDEDGIRDDVQTYLEHAYNHNPKLLGIFRRIAVIDQKLLLHAYDEKQDVKDFREWSRASSCFLRDFKDSHQRSAAVMMYERLLYNTIPRIEAHQIIERYQENYLGSIPPVRCDKRR